MVLPRWPDIPCTSLGTCQGLCAGYYCRVTLSWQGGLMVGPLALNLVIIAYKDQRQLGMTRVPCVLSRCATLLTFRWLFQVCSRLSYLSVWLPHIPEGGDQDIPVCLLPQLTFSYSSQFFKLEKAFVFFLLPFVIFPSSWLQPAFTADNVPPFFTIIKT